MSIIRADSIKNRSGAGAPDFPNGITVTGIVTSTILNSTVNNVSADDFVNVGSNIQLGNAGVVTATTFKGNIDAVDGDFDGTLEADAITVNGTALNTVIAGVTVTNSTNASIATNVTVADESSDTTCFPTFVTAATGNLPSKTGSNLTFNSSSGALTATSFSGDGSGLTNLNVGLSTEALTTAGATVTLDLTKDDHKITKSGSYTITCTGGSESSSHTLRIVNSGISTVGFSTYFLFPSGGVPSLPTANGAISLISFSVHRAGASGISTQLLSGASVNFS